MCSDTVTMSVKASSSYGYPGPSNIPGAAIVTYQKGLSNVPRPAITYQKETKSVKASSSCAYPGPSNIPGTAISSYQKGKKSRITVMKCPGMTINESKKATWKCKVCKKELSSKRSYTEHMNIHNKTRPFQCHNCTYAAASQMTLHRHKLRNHTPKSEWGYRCPYCDEVYMEPAGYQQHVQHRHTGLSATYGCPFSFCKFSSKSQRHFREHLVKHDVGDKVEGGIDPCSLSPMQLVRYMINDECGIGFDRKRKQIVVRPRKPHAIRMGPKIYISEAPPNTSVVARPRIVWQIEKVKAVPQQTQHNSAVPQNTVRYVEPNYKYLRTEQHEYLSDEELDDGPPILDRQQEEPVVTPDTDWIETEIEVGSNEVPLFPNGFIEEELD